MSSALRSEGCWEVGDDETVAVELSQWELTAVVDECFEAHHVRHDGVNISLKTLSQKTAHT